MKKIILALATLVCATSCGSPRVSFTYQGAQSLLETAYGDLIDKADTRGLGYSRVLATADTATIASIRDDLEQMRFSRNEFVRTSLDEGFQANFEQDFNRIVSEDLDRWRTLTVEESATFLSAAGIPSANDLFLAENQRRLRETMEREDFPVDFLLLAQLRGEILPEETHVEFWVDMKLISLRADVTGLQSRAERIKVKIPISHVYAFLQWIDRLFGGSSEGGRR